MKSTRFVGLDVHAATIAVAEPDGEVRSLGTIPNEPEAMRRVMKKLGPAAHLRTCYEAGPCGYVLDWQLAQLGVACQVVAPTLVPVKAGDRVKTDRRDAERLARSLRGLSTLDRCPAVRAARAGGHARGLPDRGRPRAGADRAARAGYRRGGRDRASPDARRHRGVVSRVLWNIDDAASGRIV